MSAPLPASSARSSPPAVRGLVEQYASSVYSLCNLLLKDPQPAEQDAVHTFTALGSSSRLTPDPSLPRSIQVYRYPGRTDLVRGKYVPALSMINQNHLSDNQIRAAGHA